MTRYIYKGPYQSVTFNDLGTLKTVGIGGEIDLDDEEMVNDQIRRGFHLFGEPGEDGEQVAVMGQLPDQGSAPTSDDPAPETPEVAQPEPEPQPEPAAEEEHPS